MLTRLVDQALRSIDWKREPRKLDDRQVISKLRDTWRGKMLQILRMPVSPFLPART